MNWLTAWRTGELLPNYTNGSELVEVLVNWRTAGMVLVNWLGAGQLVRCW